MKNALYLLLAASLLTACGRTEDARDNTARSTRTAADSVAATSSKSRNCQSVPTDNLGKPLEYKESAKPIVVTLTVAPDTGITQTASGCYVNNTVTVLTVRKSGKQLFRRTMSKDDLLYFVDTDAAIQQSVLQNVTYKPTFNGEKYFNLTMRLLDPIRKKTQDYLLFVNYYGEIVKVK